MSSEELPDDPETLKAMLLAERAQNDRLRQIIKEMQRHRFGRRAESLPEDQMLLGLDDAEQAPAVEQAVSEQHVKPGSEKPKRQTNRGSLPAHLPRLEQLVDIVDRTCP